MLEEMSRFFRGDGVMGNGATVLELARDIMLGRDSFLEGREGDGMVVCIVILL